VPRCVPWSMARSLPPWLVYPSYLHACLSDIRGRVSTPTARNLQPYCSFSFSRSSASNSDRTSTWRVDQTTGPKSSREIPNSRKTARTVPGARSRGPQSGMVVTCSVAGLYHVRWEPRRLPQSSSHPRARSFFASWRYLILEPPGCQRFGVGRR
jgi:hypothetical protein